MDAGQLDNRYFTESEHVDTSAGAPDAGKPVKLDAGGHVDATMINDADIDHTNIANTGSNTHAQIDAHLVNAFNPHGSTMAVTVKVQTAEVENLGGNITVDAINAAADSTVIVENSDATFKANLDVENNIIVGGTVDGRDVAVDGTKLDGIESSATADQTNAEIKTAYEANADTNEFSDAEQTKLAGIETTADVTDAANVDAAGAVMESDVAAKGDIFVATADNVLTNLSVGSNAKVLTADSAQASGVKWADVVKSFPVDWPDPVISPTADEFCIGYFHKAVEIIEIGVAICDGMFRVNDTFSTFVKPVRNPKLTRFCIDLTTITQEQVDEAPGFVEAMELFKNYVFKSTGRKPYEFEFCSWGNYDKNQFVKDCDFHKCDYPFGFHRNIKQEFSKRYGLH
ncbi:MAG: exonuclease domain-containing protein, partial [Planctomycetes bacterium]|nr:exonuclease domain-containing protein [Planctomycetota bacterium]